MRPTVPRTGSSQPLPAYWRDYLLHGERADMGPDDILEAEQAVAYLEVLYGSIAFTRMSESYRLGLWDGCYHIMGIYYFKVIDANDDCEA